MKVQEEQINSEKILLEEYKLAREQRLTVLSKLHNTVIYFLVGVIFGEYYVIKSNNIFLLDVFLLVFVGWLAYSFLISADLVIFETYIKKLEKDINTKLKEEILIFESRFLPEIKGIDGPIIKKFSNFVQILLFSWIVPYIFFIIHIVYTIIFLFNNKIRCEIKVISLLAICILFFCSIYLFFKYKNVV
jgi:hypothetical protein